MKLKKLSLSASILLCALSSFAQLPNYSTTFIPASKTAATSIEKSEVNAAKSKLYKLLKSYSSINFADTIEKLKQKIERTESQLEILNLSDSINRLQREEKRYLNVRDSLLDEFWYNNVKYTLVTTPLFGKQGKLDGTFARKSQAIYRLTDGDNYAQFRGLQSAILNYGGNVASIAAELAQGHIGGVRVSIGTMLTTANPDSASRDALIQKLANNGGNSYLNLQAPLLFVHSRNDQFGLMATARLAGLADFAALNQYSENWEGRLSAGVNIFAQATTKEKNISFFMSINGSWNTGNQSFRDNQNLKQPFWFGQASLGVSIANVIKFSFSLPTLSNIAALKQTNTIAQSQLIPSK